MCKDLKIKSYLTITPAYAQVWRY